MCENETLETQLDIDCARIELANRLRELADDVDTGCRSFPATDLVMRLSKMIATAERIVEAEDKVGD